MNIGVDIGGSKVLVVSSEKDFKLARQQKIETPSDGPQAVTEIIHMIEKVADGKTIDAIGVSSCGPIDWDKGVLFPTPAFNMTWGPTPIVDQLKNHFKVPVVLENDTNAAGLAEATIGAAKGKDYVLYVTVSTGIGTGLIFKGKIFHGANDPEGGHTRIYAEGKNEMFEAAAAGPALKRRFGLYGYEITDPEIWDEYAADLATGLRNLIITIAPEVVVIGGGVGVHFRKFEASLNKHLNEVQVTYPYPPIVPAKYMETAPVYGALILANEAKNR